MRLNRIHVRTSLQVLATALQYSEAGAIDRKLAEDLEMRLLIDLVTVVTVTFWKVGKSDHMFKTTHKE